MATFLHDCLECGKEYEAKRSTSKFCGAKCRKRHSRKHDNDVNVGVECSVAESSLKKILDAAGQDLYHYGEYIGRLRSIMAEIDERLEKIIDENLHE